MISPSPVHSCTQQLDTLIGILSLRSTETPLPPHTPASITNTQSKTTQTQQTK